MEEIWKTVITEDGIYENYMISNLGNLKSLKDSHGNYREKILSPGKDRNNYLHVILHKDGKRKNYLVHRIVAMAFIPNIPNYKCVDHINCIPSDNRIENLRWCTHKQNNNNELTKKHHSQAQKGKTNFLGKHHTEETKRKIAEAHKGNANMLGKHHSDKAKNKISEANGKKVICIETNEIFQSTMEVERQLGIAHEIISRCCRRKQKQAKSLTFRYID